MGINIEPTNGVIDPEAIKDREYNDIYLHKLATAKTDEERIEIIDEIYSDGFADGTENGKLEDLEESTSE